MKPKSTSRPGEKKKISKLTVAILAGTVIFLLYFAAVLGAAMDLSVGRDGNIQAIFIPDNMVKLFSAPNAVFAALRAGGYAPQILFFAAVAIGIFALYKYSQPKKRLHRKNVEHGSAQWGEEKEMQSLKDNGSDSKFPYKESQFKSMLSSDGTRVFDKNGELVGVLIDNNIILTKQVYMSLNSRQHLMNLNVLIIGGSGSGKTRFYAKPNILQLNTSYVITDPKGYILIRTVIIKYCRERSYVC